MSIDVAIVTCARTATALLFATALAHKLWNLGEFTRTLAQYLRGLRLGGAATVSLVAVSVLSLEGAVLAACLIPGARVLAAILACATLLGYAAAMEINIRRGSRLLDCGCSWGSARQPVSRALVVRNLLLGVGPLTMALPQTARELGFIELASIGAATIALACLYTAANHLLLLDGAARRDA